MTRTTDITNFTEHRQHLRDHFRQIRDTGRPLYVTKNGKTAAVALSPEAYDELASKAELVGSLRLIERSLKDIRGRRTHLAGPAVDQIAKRIGLKSDSVLGGDHRVCCTGDSENTRIKHPK